MTYTEKRLLTKLKVEGLIHHSDRGIEYCSNVYTQILKRNKINISMAEENHCYEIVAKRRFVNSYKNKY